VGFIARAEASKWRRKSAIHRDGANSAPSPFFSKKNIASILFLHPFRQKNTQNASADVPKRRRERAHRRDEATSAQSFFVDEKSSKKNRKNKKLKKGLGHGGMWLSRLRS